MESKRNPKPVPTLVNFRAPSDLVDQFREVVAREERTISQDLRFYMAERVDEARKQAA